MNINIFIAIIFICFISFIAFFEITRNYNLNRIKAKRVGDGQHGKARFSTHREILNTYETVTFDVENWRNKKNLPGKYGIVVGTKNKNSINEKTALIDTDDVHALMLGASGIGKTAFFLYPNIELALASGTSVLVTDTKGDIARNYGDIAKNDYGYNVAVFDLRNPTKSSNNNILSLVNKYIDKYKETNKLSDKSKAEKYAKIISKTIVFGDGDSSQYGQNSYFYESAEGLLTSIILLVSEYCSDKERHIVSVFKVIQELSEITPAQKKNNTNSFRELLNLLPDTHKAKWFAGASIFAPTEQLLAVVSTVLSKLNCFLDSELEQILCFDNDLDTEKFCETKSIIFVILPEEDTTKYFIVSLIIQQMYREIMLIADRNDGRLKKKVLFLLDEFGTLPKIQSAEMMFSASRSRGVSIVAIIQSFAQLESKYGKLGSEVIIDNCQLTIFGGFAPMSKSTKDLSSSMGNYTVLSGSVSKGKERSQSLQMMAKALMSEDEIKTMGKGTFVILKTGYHPLISKFKLFKEWGIKFMKTFEMKENGERIVTYANKMAIQQSIISKSVSDFKKEVGVESVDKGDIITAEEFKQEFNSSDIRI